jgi:hypothetical protein
MRIGGLMSTATAPSPIQREPHLLGQTVVVIGGSAGIGLETGRRARAEGAKLILTGRNPERLEHAALELEALSSAAFDATDTERLERFFDDLPTAIDHVMVSGGGPYYARLADIDFAAISWTRVASNSARRYRLGAWSARPTSPLSPFTSWRTQRSPEQPTTSTGASSSWRGEQPCGFVFARYAP